MSRVRYTTNIEEELLNKAKRKAIVYGLEGANAVIEHALRMFFSNCDTTVWEKVLSGGWVKKLVVRDDRVTFESIRSRKVLGSYNPRYYSDDALEGKGFRQVWKLKKV